METPAKPDNKTPAPSDTLSFYVPDLAPSIRAHVGNKRGGLVEWFRAIAKRDLIAAGALADGETAEVIAEVRELLVTKGPAAVRAKLSELAGNSADAAADAKS